jgi:hypothetical protein
VQLCCFTFDLEDLSDDLMSAAKRSVTVSVHSNKRTTLNQITRDQLQRLRALQANGCSVYLLSVVDRRDAYSRVGRTVPPGNGILHMKYLQVDNLAICGNANYTTSSRSNIEMSVLIELSESGMAHSAVARQMAIQTREELNHAREAEATRIMALRMEPKSVSPSPARARSACFDEEDTKEKHIIPKAV